MTHLAARGIICPQPLKNRRGEALERAGRPARRHHQLSRRHLAAQAQRRALRRRRPGAGENASGRPRFRDDARQRAVGVGLAAAVRSRPPRAPTSCSTACATFIARRTRSSRSGVWPRESAARRDPRRPVSGQRALSRRAGIRPDRFHLRLQRHAGLRRRDLPQRLVFREPIVRSTSPRRARSSTPMAASAR